MNNIEASNPNAAGILEGFDRIIREAKLAAQQALEALDDAYSWGQVYAARTALKAALAEPTIDPVDEYRKGFIAGQIDMRDRSEELAEPEQEPVAWLDEEINCAYTPEELDGGTADGLVPLYTAPPQRKPLTEEEIQELSQQHKFDSRMEKFVRIIEQAHGIGGQDD
jgi:hypothetical protein